VLTEEKLDDIGATLEYTPRKSLKRLAQETGVSKSSTRTATQLLNFRSYKIRVFNALHPRDSASWVRFCSWSLQSAFEGEIHPQLTFFLMKRDFYLHRYINIQNSRYWSSQNPHLTHEFLLNPIKVGVWFAVKFKKDCWIYVFKEKLIAKNMHRSFSGNSFQS
jgi:hypothetical protein